MDQSVDEGTAFRSALGPRHDLPRDEPEIAQGIAVQMRHMGMSPLSLSVVRRLRDIVATLAPRRLVESGASIGHLSAWMLDLWSSEQAVAPELYDVLEPGARFAVILQRVLERYHATEWGRVLVGSVEEQRDRTKAWRLAHLGSSERPSSVDDRADLIVVHPSLSIADDVRAALDLLREGGVLLTVEPEVPGEDVSPDTPEGEAIISSFNGWISLIHSLTSSHDVAFLPVTGGTIVGVRR